MTLFRYFLLFVGILIWLNPAYAQPAKPGLFVLAIGVSTYKNPKYNLKYAHKDALDLADAWRKQTDLYDVREVKTLVNEQATRANIRAALADLKKKVSPTSLLVFVFSGHGLNDALVTHEFDNDDRTATTLGRSDLTQQLSTLGGSYIALIDACHSGSFAKNFSGGKDISTESRVQQDAAIGNMLRALSAPDKANIVIGSSSSSEKSDECDACQNGYFTQCLLDAFEGTSVVDGRRIIRPDVDGNGYIETNELDPYIKDAVFFATRTNPFPQNVLAQQTIGYNFSILKPKNTNGAGQPIAFGNTATAVKKDVETQPISGGNSSAKSVSFKAKIPDNIKENLRNDNDQDGIPNVFDKCPDQQGELQFWGCATNSSPQSKWSQYSNGAIPSGAVSLGITPEGKARFLVKAGNSIGYIEQGSSNAKVYVGTDEIEVNTYDVLHKGRFLWKKMHMAKLQRSPSMDREQGNPTLVRLTQNGIPTVGYCVNTKRVVTKGQSIDSNDFEVLIDEDLEFCNLNIASFNRMVRPYYLLINGIISENAQTSFSLPKIKTGSLEIKIRYMSIKSKPKGLFASTYDTIWTNTPPIQLIASPKQTYRFLVGHKWSSSALPIVITEDSNQAIFTRPAPENTSAQNETLIKAAYSIPPPDVKVVRWKSPITGDFETLREDFNADAQLQSWGYQNKTYQFSAYKSRPNDPNATAVNRWVMPNCAASIVIAEHEIPDATLLNWGYKSKQFLFFAYQNKPNTGDFVAVNRWINAKPQGDPCRDFTLTVAETELTDAQLRSWGYSEKRLQFYVPRP